VMANRKRLRAQVTKAWQAAIATYGKRRINSESGLQSFFFYHLSELLPDELHVYFQPRLEVQTSKGTRCYPDLVLCKRGSRVQWIVGVLEFKYAPRSRLGAGRTWNGIERDFEKLGRIAAVAASHQRPSVTLAVERYLGPIDPIEFELAKDVLLCWGGVYSGPGRCEQLTTLHDATSEVHLLEAVTSEEAAPQVWVNRRRRG
jgi:hypothetical protein